MIQRWPERGGDGQNKEGELGGQSRKPHDASTVAGVKVPVAAH